MEIRASDGKIVIDTEIKASSSQKGAKKLASQQLKIRQDIKKTEQEITRLEKSLEDMSTNKIDEKAASGLEKKIVELQSARDSLMEQAQAIESKTNSKMNTLNASAGRPNEDYYSVYSKDKEWISLQKEITKTESALDRYQAELNRVNATERNQIGTSKYQKTSSKVNELTAHLKYLKKKMTEVDAKANGTGKSLQKAATKGTRSFKLFGNQMNRVGKSAHRMSMRLRSIVASALLFNIISQGLRNLTEYFGKTLKTNETFSNSLANVKGNLLTAFQPIYERIMPALNTLMSALSKATSYLASFTSKLFGKTVKSSQEAAKSLYEEANAADEAAEKTSKLSAIDELNVANKDTSSTSSTTSAINFDADDYSDEVSSIVDALKEGDWESIGETVAEGINGALYSINGVITSFDWDGVGSDIAMFLNGAFTNIDMVALATTLSETIKGALSLVTAFLTTFDWQGFGNQIGELIKNIDWGGIFVDVIKFIIAAFAVATLELPSMVWTILLAAIGEILDLFDGYFAGIDGWFKHILIDPLCNLISAMFGTEVGDACREFLYQIVDLFTGSMRGLVSTVRGLLGDIGNAFTTSFSSIKTILNNIISFVKNVFSGNWSDAWQNIKNIFKAVFDALYAIFKVPINLIITGFNKLISGVITALNTMIKGVNVVISGLNKIPGVDFDKISTVSTTKYTIPRLATGTVVPANFGEFQAILGDNKREPEVVSPLSTMKQAFKEVMQEYGGNTIVSVTLEGDANGIFKVVKTESKKYKDQTGKNAFA